MLFVLIGYLVLRVYINGYVVNGVNGYVNCINGVNGYYYVNGNGINGYSMNGINGVNGYYYVLNWLFVLLVKIDKSFNVYLFLFVEFFGDENFMFDWFIVCVDDVDFIKNFSYIFG